LAVGSTPYRVQAGYSDVQDTSRHCTDVSVGRCQLCRLRSSLDWVTFDVAVPRIWNKLPYSMNLIEDFGYFRRFQNHIILPTEAVALSDVWFYGPVTNSVTYLLGYQRISAAKANILRELPVCTTHFCVREITPHSRA